MQQVIFRIPGVNYDLPGFGLMLLLSFVVVVWWSKSRTPRVGLPWERFQDMAMLLLLTGIAGARLVYMIQYYDQFRDLSTLELIWAFFKIWDGGIVFYGSVFGGFLGYLAFRRVVVKKLGVNGWQLADAVAPLLAIGMAIGRIGCYLNGCCWGQVACAECQPMPLPPELGQFPLIPAHARKQVVWPADENARLPQLHGLQTAAGFSIRPRQEGAADSRSVVAAVEPNTAAERAGLQAGDKVVGLNGGPNNWVIEVNADAAKAGEVRAVLEGESLTPVTIDLPDGRVLIRAESELSVPLMTAEAKLTPLRVVVLRHDSLYQFVQAGPLGQTRLDLVVERSSISGRVPVGFTPRTVTFFPTQVYETISMVLLTLLLLAFQPFRRHDGQVMVLLMAGYAVHRFLNEAIRIEPTYRFGLTLSQWISVGILAAAVGLELFLRRTQPKLPPGPVPLGYGVKPTQEAVPAAV